MARREYQGAATPTTITSAITNSATSLTLTASTGWPTGSFSAVIDPGLAGEEKILCTSRSGATVTITTRGYDGTTAASHNAGATIYPVPTAIDFDESNAHINSTAGTTGIHGLTGALVGTTDTQTFTNKDLTSATNIFPASISAGKNAVINGGMDIWQRGTSATLTAGNVFVADRFITTVTASTNCTISQVASGLTGFRYAQRVQRTSGQSTAVGIWTTQNIETANSIPFAGQTVTFSFWARAGSGFTGAFTYSLISGTGTDETAVGGSFATGSVAQISLGATLTTSWVKYSASVTLPSTATELAISTRVSYSGTSSANDYYDLTGVQLELGSVATTFSRAGGTIQGELAACQRYYFRLTADATKIYSSFGNGSAGATTAVNITLPAPVTMRIAPTVIEYSTLALSDGVTVTAVTSVSMSTALTNANYIGITPGVASGLTQFRFYTLNSNNSANGYVGFSAEL